MESRTLTIPLRGFGCEPTSAVVTVTPLTGRQRVRRAGSVFGIGLLAALVALPIPIVHFFFVPAALLGGIIVGFLRLRQHEVVELAEGPCPCCGVAQPLGLAGGALRLPHVVHCRSCGRSLELEGPAA
jgi:hypothetical protein